jgi:hypothetical protein
MKCIICKGSIEPNRTPDGEIYWTGGNNAEPVKSGRCCEECNNSVVIPARFYMERRS